MNYGKNTAELNIEGAEAAPYEVFVGNTHPKATEALVSDVLIKYARLQSINARMEMHQRAHHMETVWTDPSAFHLSGV